MAKISVILPAYERADAVLCALEGLENQTLEGYQIVVVDDSGSDVVANELSGYGCSIVFGDDWLYLRASPPRVGRFTVSRARNMGAANASGELLVFIDQDIILAPDCLERYAEAYERHGDNVVIAGLYDWLPCLDFGTDDIRTRFDALVDDAFGAKTFPELIFKQLPMPADEQGILGRDFRRPEFGDVYNVVADGARFCFGGNVGYPRELYMALGGFDENIRSYGGEDIDMALMAQAGGAKFLLWDAIWGVHRWHPIDRRQNNIEMQDTIKYIDSKHGDGVGHQCCGGGGLCTT